jgi:membrane protein DedA with SNARE-associated domain
VPEEVVIFITRYGYMAIFILVFLQEIGVPNPVPNELVLLFSGYLSFKGLLYLPLIILTAVVADFIGTNILYIIFYHAGTYIMRKKPKWIPLSASMLERLSRKISEGGLFNIYIFRVTPFTRGYTSVITGLLRIKPGIFLPIALISASTWATIYVVIGYIIGPSWKMFSKNIGSFKYILLAVLVIVCFTVLLFYFYRKRGKNKAKAPVIQSLTL